MNRVLLDNVSSQFARACTAGNRAHNFLLRGGESMTVDEVNRLPREELLRRAEAQWLDETQDPAWLLGWVPHTAGWRKFFLFESAYVRVVGSNTPYRYEARFFEFVELAYTWRDKSRDGSSTYYRSAAEWVADSDQKVTYHGFDVCQVARMSAANRLVSVGVPPEHRAAVYHLLQCVFGNPFRPVAFDPAWRTPDVVARARAAYTESDPQSAALDPALVREVAVALRAAGCRDDGLLGHLEGVGPHFRGCLVLDMIRGRDSDYWREHLRSLRVSDEYERLLFEAEREAERPALLAARAQALELAPEPCRDRLRVKFDRDDDSYMCDSYSTDRIQNYLIPLLEEIRRDGLTRIVVAELYRDVVALNVWKRLAFMLVIDPAECDDHLVAFINAAAEAPAPGSADPPAGSGGDDLETSIRAFAPRALLHRSEDKAREAIPGLTALLSDPSPDVRESAAAVLKELALRFPEVGGVVSPTPGSEHG